jgi:S-DNA-T family DNA segregation ATPase FtsK/SpoIIIE
MSRVYISEQDEVVVKQVMRKALRGTDREPKWKALRLALALSLARQDAPSEDYDDYRPKGGDYSWEQVCGQGLDSDYTDAYRAILSVFHDMDLFSDEKGEFARLLQRHIRRGLSEIRTGWRETHDFYEFLYQELLSRTPVAAVPHIDIADRLLGALKELGVAVDITGRTDGARLQSFNFLLSDATQYRVLQRASGDLSLILGTGPITFALPGTPRTVTALIPKPKSAWTTITWADVKPFIPPTEAAKMGVCLGFDPAGAPVTFDLAQAPHLLVAGTTNSGKSVALHAIICSLLARHTTETLNLCLIDPKQVEFTPYKKLPHLIGNGLITEMNLAKDALDDIVTEMGIREAKMAELGFKNLIEWQEKRTDAPAFVVICVEELADLIMQHPEAEVPLVRIAQKGRASGIHLVLATQRPDSVTLSGLLRTNVPSRIALTVQKATESRIILDDTGAELLLGQGDALVKIVGEPVRRVQCALLTSNDIKTAISSTVPKRKK